MKKSSYKLWATRLYSIMFNQGFCEYTIDNGCEAIYVVPVGDSKADYIVEKDSFESACSRIGAEFIRNHKELIDGYQKRAEKVIFTASSLSEKAGKIDDGELLGLYEQYWAAARDFQPYMMFPHYAEQELEPMVKEKYPDIFSIISGLSKPLQYMEMNYALFTEPIEDVLKKYSYMPVQAMTEKPFDINDLERIKNNLNFEKAKEAIAETRANAEAYQSVKSRINADDKILCDVLHDFAFIRTDRVDVWKRHAYILYPFAKYCAQKIDASSGVREGSMLSRDEIISILSGKKVIDKSKLIERGLRQNVTASYSREGVVFVDNPQAVSEIRKLVSDEIGHVSEIKGISACKGYEEGHVKLLMNSKDISDSDHGYILVTRHTTPQDLPYMKRAKAIVTDEGGITCHAAIVSRELKIPCVIGTKISTKVLKDGDFVSVDANSGVVKKI